MPPRTHSPDSSATIAPSTSSSSTPEPPVSGGEQPKQPQQDGDSVEKQSEGKNDGSGNGTKTETETGNSKKSEEKDPNRVGFEGDDDPYNPQNLSTMRKWLAVLAVSSGATCVTCASSMSTTTYTGIESTFSISEEVATLSISLFVLGLGLGPMLLAPLSEFYGRRWVYLASFGFFLVLNLGVAFANVAAVHLLFRFLTGFVGSAFLSVAGGTVTDLFSNHEVGVPMAVYSMSPFIGPVLGPLIAGFINQNTDWRWTYYVILIWTAVEIVFLVFFAPETLASRVLYYKAKSLRKSQNNPDLYAPVEKSGKSLAQAIMMSVKIPFELILEEPMVTLLNLWTALLLGILYLFFGAFGLVFGDAHGFSLEQTGLAFLGIGGGEVIAGLSTHWWLKHYRAAAAKNNGKAPPETRLVQGMAGGILVTIGMFAFAFTTYESVPWIVPILMSGIFGAGMLWVFTSVFSFLVDAYRPVAASAMASNSFMRSCFAAGFPLFGTQMYHRLGNAGATALLAGLTALMIPLPFIFYRLGPRLRANSKYGSS